MLIPSIAVSEYVTRRVRRQVHGPDIRAVQEKQITIPLIVPWGLENYLLSTLPQEYDDLPPHFADFKPLIPVHDSLKYDPASSGLPSLRDTASEKGNLRYWVITNESMWASQHRVMDDFAEIAWALFHWFNQAVANQDAYGDTPFDISCASSHCCWQIARSFRRRIVLPQIEDKNSIPESLNSGLPSCREMLLFRPWALISPPVPDREFAEEISPPHELYEERGVRYPFPDPLFWDPGDEGAWDEEGVPEWVQVSDDRF